MSSSREAALDELETAAQEWIDKEKERIQNEVLFLRSVLEGSTGSGTLRRMNSERAGLFLYDSISRFLED